MKINYELTLNDCKIFAKEIFFIKRLLSSFLKDNLRRALIASILISLGLAYLLFDLNIKAIILLFICTFLFAYIFWGLMSYYAGGKFVYKLLDGTDKNYELTVDGTIIKRTSSSSENTFYWKNVKDVYNTKSNILIFVSDRMAIIIPKRLFDNESDVNAFWNNILSYYKTTKTQ